jgi:hypothetical protein
VEECEPCPIFASFSLAFALQLRKKHGKTSVRVRKNLSQVKEKPLSGFSEKYSNTKFHEIPSRVFHADGRADRQQT